MALGHKLLSICIPTYNRASRLENLLNVLISQIMNHRDSIELCISNNASSDNTHNVVMKLIEKYPDIINYNENAKNLGFDANLWKVVSMARGLFVWTFGDDDSITDNGVDEVISFIKRINHNNVGLIILRQESYFIGKNLKRIIYHSTKDEKKPDCFSIDKNDIIGGSFDGSFMSVLLFNNVFLQRVLKEDTMIIEKGVKTYYIHVLLYRLMFLKFPHIIAYVLNKTIICQKMPHYTFLVEDEFDLAMNGRAKIENILLSTDYSKEYGALFIRFKINLLISFITRLAYMKAFGNFNYHNYAGCLIKIFSAKMNLFEKLILSTSFVMISITPSIMVQSAIISLLKRSNGSNWEKSWLFISSVFLIMGKNGRRRLQEP